MPRGRGRMQHGQETGPRRLASGGVTRRNQRCGNRRFALRHQGRQHGAQQPMPRTEPLPLLRGTRGDFLPQQSLEPQNYTEAPKALALDCEMVGVGVNGKISTLARVSIVNEDGQCLYDSFAQPPVPVTDYRTDRSGVRESDLRGAPPADEVKRHVANLVHGCILIGHGLENDLLALGLQHIFPRDSVRDTAIYFELRNPGSPTPGLKRLVREYLRRDIQTGEHNSITDAQTVMELYQQHKRDWEWYRENGNGASETWILEKRLARKSRQYALP